MSTDLATLHSSSNFCIIQLHSQTVFFNLHQHETSKQMIKPFQWFPNATRQSMITRCYEYLNPPFPGGDYVRRSLRLPKRVPWLSSATMNSLGYLADTPGFTGE